MPSPQHSLPFPDPAEPAVVLVPAKPPALPRSPRTWYFIGTALFGIGAFAVETIAQLVMFAVLIFGFGVAQVQTGEEAKAVMMNGAWLSLAIIAGCPFLLGALWIPVRSARQSYSDYLGLRWPSRGEVATGLAMLAVFQLVWFLLRLAFGHAIPDFMIDTYKTAKASGALDVYVIGFCVAAPVAEEFLFRGFVLRGWSQSFLRPAGAVVLSSLVWAYLHSQYNLFYMVCIFTFGILLGTLRLRSGSTWLTVMLHALHNLIAVAQVAWLIG
jgi:membrane protease YdiL (CAAX protease family)